MHQLRAIKQKRLINDRIIQYLRNYIYYLHVVKIIHEIKIKRKLDENERYQ